MARFSRTHAICLGIVAVLCLTYLVYNFTGDGGYVKLFVHSAAGTHQTRDDAVPTRMTFVNGEDVMESSSTTAEYPTPDTKVRVLIVASMRTGSSFIGDMFGSSDDVFYLFEPGLSLKDFLNAQNMTHLVQQNIYLDMLTKLFRCDFSNLEFYLQWLYGTSLKRIQTRAPRLYQDICSHGSYSYKNKCQITPEMASESCRKRKYIVIKSIRVPDISLVVPLFEEKVQLFNLKVLHVVRDPRGMIASRVSKANDGKPLSLTEQGELPTQVTEILFLYCLFNSGNLELGMRSPRLKDRYMLLRYEDAAIDPRSTAGELYRYIGYGLVPDSVLDWIRENTMTNAPGTMSTTRNSSQVYHAWRRSLHFNTVKAIENTGRCKWMMARFGYDLVRDENHLDDLSRPLVKEVPSADHDWINL